MGMNKKMTETKVRIGEVRFGFVNLFKKRITDDNPDGKYSVQILIPKNNTEALKVIEAAVEVAKKNGVGKKWDGMMPPASKIKLPLRDGDDEFPNDENYEGMWFMNASFHGDGKPGVRVLDGKEVTDKKEDGFTPINGEDFYSGCYGVATVDFFAYKKKGNMGVAAGIHNVIKTRDGAHLSGGESSAESDFSDLGETDSWAD